MKGTNFDLMKENLQNAPSHGLLLTLKWTNEI